MPSSRPRAAVAAATAAAALAGGVATDPRSTWFARLAKPGWYPPPATFGIVWSALYAGRPWAGGEVLTRSAGDAAPFRRALGGQPRAQRRVDAAVLPRPPAGPRATAECAVLALSGADLVRRAAAGQPAGRGSARAVRRLDGVRHGPLRLDRPPQPLTGRGGLSRSSGA